MNVLQAYIMKKKNLKDTFVIVFQMCKNISNSCKVYIVYIFHEHWKNNEFISVSHIAILKYLNLRLFQINDTVFSFH